MFKFAYKKKKEMFQRAIYLENIKIHHCLETLFQKINKNMKTKIKILKDRFSISKSI
jgi:hypothetical protein